MMRLLRRAKDALNGFVLFAAFLVGRVPVHVVRLACYRHIFRVSIGQKTSVHWRTVFFQPSGVTIGRHSIIGNDCFLDGRRSIHIGDNVNVGGHVQIYTLEHDPQAADFGVKGGPVIIDDFAYVATRATLLPGITVGEGSVVAAGAVVTKDVPPYAIVGGVPASIIGSRSRDLRYTLDYHLPFQ